MADMLEGCLGLEWVALCWGKWQSTGEVEDDEDAESNAGRTSLRGADGVWTGSTGPGMGWPRGANCRRGGLGALAIRARAIKRRRARRSRARRAAGRLRTRGRQDQPGGRGS